MLPKKCILCCFLFFSCILNCPDLYILAFQISMNAFKVAWVPVAKSVPMFQGPIFAPACLATHWIMTSGPVMLMVK